jgi:hypothetical protein
VLAGYEFTLEVKAAAPEGATLTYRWVEADARTWSKYPKATRNEKTIEGATDSKAKITVNDPLGDHCYRRYVTAIFEDGTYRAVQGQVCWVRALGSFKGTFAADNIGLSLVRETLFAPFIYVCWIFNSQYSLWFDNATFTVFGSAQAHEMQDEDIARPGRIAPLWADPLSAADRANSENGGSSHGQSEQPNPSERKTGRGQPSQARPPQNQRRRDHPADDDPGGGAAGHPGSDL